MRKSCCFFFLLILTAFISCQKSEEELFTLPEIDISGSSNGIVELPEDVPSIFRDVFSKYTKILAPNGKPIHILAQAGWTDDQVKKGRNVLEFILTDYPGSEYGNDKSVIANTMADRKATMVFFNTEPDLHEAMRGPLRRGTDLSMQDLRGNENPAEGSEDYMNHITRDASFEEIWHLVHDYGIKPTQPVMLAEMREANDKAAEKGWRAWPDDEPQEHPNEYVGVLIDNYYDLWTLRPKKYEGREIKPEDVPEGQSHFGRYFAASRERMKELDPDGYALIQKFFPPYLTYTPELPGYFESTFSLTFDESLVYTYKSQHLANVTLTGSNDSSLIGNGFDNTLKGNAGNNVFEGKGGNDKIDGGTGTDTAVFSGPHADYRITETEKGIIVEDSQQQRDGVDKLTNIEILKFSDKEIKK
ncbi:MAG: hypothetical protein JSV17_04455 [Candidatus Aminicenantes bacterium]|nr:MAG: hypothetical protein JSV17_04455 [Candidatus Aminicenantes bacterium]